MKKLKLTKYGFEVFYNKETILKNFNKYLSMFKVFAKNKGNKK